MSDDQYLSSVLEKQALGEESPEMDDIRTERKKVDGILRSAFKDTELHIREGGSKAKHTMVRTSYDLDLTCYFTHGDDTPGSSLEEIYDNVHLSLANDYHRQKKKSAIRLMNKVDEKDFHIDVVPGRFVDDKNEDVFIFRRERDKSRLKTNLDTHVTFIRDSGLTEVIQLAKLWRDSLDLDIKTFILELLVVKYTSLPKKGLSDRLKSLMVAFVEKEDLSIEDPANPVGNVLSDIFTNNVKKSIKLAAKNTVAVIDEEGWEGVFGAYTQEEQPPQPSATALRIGDTQHQQKPEWHSDIKYNVRILGRAQWRPGSKYRPFKSDFAVFPDGISLKFLASTDTPEPFDVRWQVVNTGEHAASLGKKGLRGDFFKAKGRSVDLSGNPLENYEHTEYTGKHWIQCFIIKGGVLVAKSEPFYIRIVNREYRS